MHIPGRDDGAAVSRGGGGDEPGVQGLHVTRSRGAGGEFTGGRVGK